MKAIRHFHNGAHTPSKAERAMFPHSDCRTVVVDNCPSASIIRAWALEQMATLKVIHYPLNVGIARLHPNDQYNKKIGVQVASEAAKKINYFSVTFRSVPNNGSLDIYALFKATSKESPVWDIELRVDARSSYPEIMYASSQLPRWS